ncbi:MAG: hypothetical protein AAF587_22955 [Bacteroidota bacterium]
MTPIQGKQCNNLWRLSFLLIWLMVWILAIVPNTLQAQSATMSVDAPQEAAPLQLGLGWWGFDYRGDLSSSNGMFERVYPGFDVSLQFDNNKPVGIQFHAGYGRFVAQTEEEPIPGPDDVLPNTFVETPFFYTDLRLRWYVIRRFRIKPYLSAGAGLLFFRPLDKRRNFLGENFFTRLPEEEYLTSIASFPLSAGLVAKVARQIHLGISYTYRLTTTDYLDNIGQLGEVAGNDRLHGLGVSLYLSLSTPQNASPAPPRPSSRPQHWVDNRPKDSSLLLSHQDDLHPSLDSTVLLRIQMRKEDMDMFQNLWRQELREIPPLDMQYVEAPIYTTSSLASDSSWITLEETALQEQLFQQITTEYPMTVRQLSERYHIRIQTIRNLNPNLPASIPVQSLIRIPDLGLGQDRASE